MSYLFSQGDTVSIEALRHFIDRLCEERELSAGAKALLLEQVEKMKVIYGQHVEKRTALRLLAKQIDITRTGFIRDPVDIIEFIESPEYMNQGLHVRPRIMENLISLWKEPEKYYEVVLGGAIGIGKNYFADMSVAYQLYRMSCLFSPQIYYGLAPGSGIVFSFQSKNLGLARRVVFTQFTGRLEASGYFPKHFPYSHSYKSELKFAHNISIVPLAGTETSALGMNIFTAVIDEMNFMGRVAKSKLTQHTGEEEYDQAEKLYQVVLGRLKSRFATHGRIPGKLFLISSANYKGDFIDKKTEEAKTNPQIYVMKMPQWEALPRDRFGGKKFWVIVPTETTRGSVHVDKPAVKEGVIEVPIEYFTEFSRDMDTAIRNVAGIPLAKRGRFLETDSVRRAMNRYKQLFNYNQVFQRDHIPFDEFPAQLSGLLNMPFIKLISKLAPFGVHIDFGYRDDAAGIAIGCIGGMRDIGVRKVLDPQKGDYVEEAQGKLPVIIVVGVLKVAPPIHGEIDLNVLRDLVLLIGMHLPISFVTLDSWQSIATMQAFRAKGMPSSLVSLDSKPDGYNETKNALRDDRVLMPDSEVLIDEFGHLEIDRSSNKIDHEVGHSKDLSDAVAGVIYGFSKRKKSYRDIAWDPKALIDRLYRNVPMSSSEGVQDRARPSSGRPTARNMRGFRASNLGVDKRV